MRTVYVTDNPTFEGPALSRRAPAQRLGAGGRSGSSAATGGIEGEIAALERATKATERTFKAGIAALRELNGDDPFFLAIDPFDPIDAEEAPPILVKPGEVDEEGIGPMDGRLVELQLGTATRRRCARPTATTSRRSTAGSAG